VRRTIKVTADMRYDISAHDFAEYVKEAIQGWSGAFHPDDERRSIGNVEVRFTAQEGKP
jgi:hypothetical protein